MNYFFVVNIFASSRYEAMFVRDEYPLSGRNIIHYFPVTSFIMDISKMHIYHEQRA